MQFDAESIFGPSGLLAQYLPGYEFRQEQLVMAEHIAHALAGQRHALVEAGTGVGKSLAYLIPLIYYAAGEGKRAVVATHTITLQEQLFTKDLPFLAQALPVEFTAEVFKGRRNYLCLARLQEQTQKNLLHLTDPSWRQLLDWAAATTTGDRSEVPQIPTAIWNVVCCEKETCPEELCPLFDQCFYWKLRHKLSRAQLIVTNQALFLADLQAGGSILPKYDAVVIDEAHNLEEVATTCFSQELSREKFFALHRTGVSLIGKLEGLVPAVLLVDLRLTLDQVTMEAARYFDAILPLITPPTTALDDGNWRDFARTELPRLLEELVDSLDFGELDDGEANALAVQLKDFATNLGQTVNLILSGSDPGYVYWAELQGSEAVLFAAPIAVQDELADKLFSQVPTAILTSATLSTNGSFAYTKDRVGLVEADELILGSPFDFQRQAVLCVPHEAKPPRHPLYAKYTAYLILHTAAAAQGGTLALFTSYRLMDEVADLVAEKLAQEGYTLLVQGDGPRGQLLDEFRTTPRAVLFGTNSFWEGIDIPGDALRAVVITRLPFAVPDRPVTAARLRAIEQAGGNAFLQYSVPQAILRLKQGFGRLIRTHQDRGAVVILDERVISAGYGSQFLNSLPPAHFTRDIGALRALFSDRAKT
ncbi:MAG: ATP-dependent DNA helicase [Limnochordia bacterium]